MNSASPITLGWPAKGSRSATPIRAPEAADNRVPLGHHSTGTLSLDLDRLLAGRLLIQGSSGAGKSKTLRRIIEEAFEAGIPESFNVLVKEMRSLGLNVELENS